MDLKKLALLWATAILASPSFSPAIAPPGPARSPAQLPAGINWVRYSDNAEDAFSMDVPLGWQVQGGMYRFGYFDVRWMMDVRSLDGKVIIRINDPNVPPYVLPGPHTGRAGESANKEQMYQMVVADYSEARPYAQTYAKHRFSAVCNSFTPSSADWTPAMPPAWRSDKGATVTEASVSYGCDTSDGPRAVMVYARSTLSRGIGLWQVDPLISFIATPESVPLAESMIQHMIDSWEENPQWEDYQKEITQYGLEQIRAGFSQFIQQMQAYHQQREAAMNQQVAGFQAQQNAQAQQVSGWGQALTGVTTVSDSTTGTKFQIFSGPKANYYTNGNGVTINSNLSPGPGFHQVNPVSR
jgi:hypothetical protein